MAMVTPITSDVRIFCLSAPVSLVYLLIVIRWLLQLQLSPPCSRHEGRGRGKGGTITETKFESACLHTVKPILLILGCGKGKCRVYCRAPSKEC